jgi:deoxyadenosine/deoxycytidine kinase
MERIAKRGRPFEKNMPRDYIETLNRAYNHFFFHYDETPLVMVNTDSLDLPRSPTHIEKLIEVVNTHKRGTIYYRGGSE